MCTFIYAGACLHVGNKCVTEWYFCGILCSQNYIENNRNREGNQVFCSKQIAAALEIHLTGKRQNSIKRIITQKSNRPFFKLIKHI